MKRYRFIERSAAQNQHLDIQSLLNGNEFMESAWLQCEVSKGQFSGEFAVRAVDSSGQFFSLFVREEDLDSSNERLRVKKLASSGDVVLIELPQETLENGNTVSVNMSQVCDANRELA